MRLKKIKNNIKTLDALKCKVNSCIKQMSKYMYNVYINLKINNVKSKLRVNMVVKPDKNISQILTHYMKF